MRLAERGGEYGYFLLYMCIRDAWAQGENPHGHGSAIAALETNGKGQVCIYIATLGLGHLV